MAVERKTTWNDHLGNAPPAARVATVNDTPICTHSWGEAIAAQDAVNDLQCGDCKP